MTLRHTLFSFVPGVIAVGLLACGQPSTPAASPPFGLEVADEAEEIANPTAIESPQTKPRPTAELLTKQAVSSEAEPFDTVDACMTMFAYDPTDTSVNFREQPEGEVIASLPNLSRLQTEGPAYFEPGWNYVFDMGGKRWGYVWGDLIYRTYYQVQDPQDTYANLRQSPNGAIITAVANGTHVQFRGVDGSWTQVQLEDGRVGYVSSGRLDLPSCF